MDADRGVELTARERRAVHSILDRIMTLARFLQESPVPREPTSADLFSYLARMKEIQGNTDNGTSLVACLLAKEYLYQHLTMVPFDVAAKPQGAPGLDIDERTTDDARVVAEIKTTVPYGAKDLGAAQKASFESDFKKLGAAQAHHRFFFVTDRHTFEIVRARYAPRIRGVRVVLLPCGEAFVA